MFRHRQISDAQTPSSTRLGTSGRSLKCKEERRKSNVLLSAADGTNIAADTVGAAPAAPDVAADVFTAAVPLLLLLVLLLLMLLLLVSAVVVVVATATVTDADADAG